MRGENNSERHQKEYSTKISTSFSLPPLRLSALTNDVSMANTNSIIFPHLGSLDLAGTLVPCNATLLAEGGVSFKLLLLVGDLAGSLVLVHSREGNSNASGGSGEVVALIPGIRTSYHHN